MYELTDTKENLELVASKTLHDKLFKKIFSANEYNKVKEFLEELKNLDCEPRQKIKVTDTEDKLLITIVEWGVIYEIKKFI